MSDVNIVIGGEAGQGLATIGGLMAKALVRSGYEVHVTQDYLSRIRGGHNTFQIRFGPEPVLAPRETVDVLVALAPETIDLFKDKLSKRGVVVLDEKTAEKNHLSKDIPRLFKVPFKELAPKPLFANTVALGVLASVICSDMSVLEDLLRQTFGKKGEDIVRQNLDVLQAAAQWKERHEALFECPAPPEKSGSHLTLNGNQAIALGALAAGCNFLSFYPMTPGTSVALTLIQHARDVGLVAEQAEDEIAAINMAVAASYAGGRSIVSTSGGGFALMCEGISLAGAIETPVVVVIAQRPGPATGLPTRTEQGDLNMVLHAGHGEFPRTIFAPGNVEQCFHLAHRAFDQAEKHQSPAFVLTDQYLADSFRSVPPFDPERLPPVARPVGVPHDPQSYERFAVEKNGLSPRAIPGLSEALVVADSDEHTPDGHITEDLKVRITQQDKRMCKLCGAFADAIAPDYYGDEDADLVLVCWGSSMGACLEAMGILRGKGRKVGVLHFSQVYPIDPSGFMDRLTSAGKVVFVEGNSTGQFAGLIRKETGFTPQEMILRYDGLPFTSRYILADLTKIEEARATQTGSSGK